MSDTINTDSSVIIDPTYSGNASISNTSSSLTNLGNNIASISLGNMIVLFISIILILSVFMKLFGMITKSSDTGEPTYFSYLFLDIVGFIIIGFFISYHFIFVSEPERINHIKTYLSEFNDYASDPSSIYYTMFFIFLLYVSIFITQIPMNGAKPFIIGFIDSTAWLFLFVSVINNFIHYIFNINIVDNIVEYIEGLLDNNSTIYGNVYGNTLTIGLSTYSHIFSGNTTPEPTTITTPIPTEVKSAPAPVKDLPDEVFNINNNLYTYDDAQAICKAYGSRLATYDDIEDTYNKGGEWCNYGWSEGQMAFFPTQKSTWLELQTSEKTKNNCGRPGINGGYMANPYLKFGVNCFGKKPEPSDADLANMAAKQNRVVPKTPEQHELDKKVEFWRENKEKILQLNSFNDNKWSEY